MVLKEEKCGMFQAGSSLSTRGKDPICKDALGCPGQNGATGSETW